MSKSLGYKNTSSERTRKAFSIEEKLEIIKRFERSERTRDIARATGLKESTLRTIRDNVSENKINKLHVFCKGKVLYLLQEFKMFKTVVAFLLDLLLF
jgi:hypothetical protein